tara:strand:+ start:1695 stop:2042 length:348 start_codon:yes stop_codon:yes gene_type:complete
MNRQLTFLIGCLGARLLLALIAKNSSREFLNKLGYITLLISIGFMSIYMFDLRPSGFEAGGKIWWNDLRPLHGVLYLLFSMYAIKGETEIAWIVLLYDVMIGFLAWYLNNKNIKL